MPKNDRSPGSDLSEELLLAAIARAQCHQSHDGKRGVVLSTIIDHLALPRGSWTTRRLRPKLDALEAAGLLERLQQYGATGWALTANGHLWLGIVRLAGEIDALPEAPQHKTWRKAHTTAKERFEEFKDDLCVVLEDAQLALDTEGTSSNEWFALSERLRFASWRVGSATYCLREWAEPDDSKADLDPPTEHGRRDIHRREP